MFGVLMFVDPIQPAAHNLSDPDKSVNASFATHGHSCTTQQQNQRIAFPVPVTTKLNLCREISMHFAHCYREN